MLVPKRRRRRLRRGAQVKSRQRSSGRRPAGEIAKHNRKRKRKRKRKPDLPACLSFYTVGSPGGGGGGGGMAGLPTSLLPAKLA